MTGIEQRAATANLFCMRPLLSRLALTVATVMVGGCSMTPAQPAKPPPLIAPETQLTPQEALPAETRELDQPPLIAPPPAYGNKVVMARAGGPSNFY